MNINKINLHNPLTKHRSPAVEQNYQNEPEQNNTQMKSANELLSNYAKASIQFSGLNKPLLIIADKLKTIPNFAQIEQNGIRGESLSSKKNRWYLKYAKQSGITSIIDLRDRDASIKYSEACKELGIKYFNIPIDSAEIESREIIEKLPDLFKIINEENYYIACALGLHRTDIALALNYLFNPIKHAIPEMKGHQRNGLFKSDDIMRRINSIYKSLTEEDLKKLGWDEHFDAVFNERKQLFLKDNKLLASKTKTDV